MPSTRTVAMVTLGCARNEVDSEELAGRLAGDGWTLVDAPETAEVVLVNTCGFIEAAKAESIDTLLAAADLKSAARPTAVVAVGCLAERYGEQLASALPEADAVLGFDHYQDIAARLRAILAGEHIEPHPARDRRTLLPVTPVQRPLGTPRSLRSLRSLEDFAGTPPLWLGEDPARTSPHPDRRSDGAGSMESPLDAGHAGLQRVLRRRLGSGPAAPLKIASGCDRRCSFCAIPSFRGAFLSRPPEEILAEARWLAGQGVREIVLVSENSTSYGKDLGDLRLLESLLPALAAVDGIEWIRVSYLQPAELRPGLVDVITGTPGVAPYFDLSFQHASPPVLRRMRRFGGTDRFLDLLGTIRRRCLAAGARSNFIVGFPGETEEDLAELERFLIDARLDAIGVFGYSDEDGTEAARLDGKLPAEEIGERVAQLSALADQLVTERAQERVGETVEILLEGLAEGRAIHQAPEVDGTTSLHPADRPAPGAASSETGERVDLRFPVGALVPAKVVDAIGADLVAVPIGEPR